MSDREDLLRMIIDKPDDDAPRLVYADWLEEHDQPERAEFIRVQIELEQIPWGDERRPHLLEREQTLRVQHRQAWLDGLPWPEGVSWSTEFRRGFPHRPEFASARVFGAHADEVFAAAPIQSIWVSRADGISLEMVVDSPYARRLRELWLVGAGIRATAAFLITTAQSLKGLTLLNLSSNWLGDDGAQHIAHAAALLKLETLLLTGNRIGTTGGRALARESYFSSMLKLNVRDNPIDATALSLLRERFPRLVC